MAVSSGYHREQLRVHSAHSASSREPEDQAPPATQLDRGSRPTPRNLFHVEQFRFIFGISLAMRCQTTTCGDNQGRRACSLDEIRPPDGITGNMVEPDVIRRRFVVTGRVQGVGFRAWTVRRGEALGLNGTVSNQPDGSVEVEVEGPPESVWRLRELLARGPAIARVRSLEEAAPTSGSLAPGMRIR